MPDTGRHIPEDYCKKNSLFDLALEIQIEIIELLEDDWILDCRRAYWIPNASAYIPSAHLQLEVLCNTVFAHDIYTRRRERSTASAAQRARAPVCEISQDDGAHSMGGKPFFQVRLHYS